MAPVSTDSASTPGPRARSARGSSEAGLATATGLILTLLVLIMFVFASMSVAMYFFELAHLRAAVNEAVRAGEPFGMGEAECNERFDELRELPGSDRRTDPLGHRLHARHRSRSARRQRRGDVQLLDPVPHGRSRRRRQRSSAEGPRPVSRPDAPRATTVSVRVSSSCSSSSCCSFPIILITATGAMWFNRYTAAQDLAEDLTRVIITAPDPDRPPAGEFDLPAA